MFLLSLQLLFVPLQDASPVGWRMDSGCTTQIPSKRRRSKVRRLQSVRVLMPVTVHMFYSGWFAHVQDDELKSTINLLVIKNESLPGWCADAVLFGSETGKHF